MKRSTPLGYRKPDPRGNYFTVPNEIFCFDLCPGELAVYLYLLKCEDRHSFQCWPSYTTIGKATGMSKNTVKKHVASLEEKYFIRTESTHRWAGDGMKLNGSLLYRIRPMYAVRYHQNQRTAERAVQVAKARRRVRHLQKTTA